MGLFDELDVAGAADNPFAIPDDTYEAVVSDVIVKKNEEKGTTGMTVKYKVTAGEYVGREVTEYRRIPKKDDKTPLDEAGAAQARSYLKRTLSRLGIPEDRMNTADRNDLVGIQCYVSTTMNGDFINVRDVTLQRPANVGSATTADANPFATASAE